MIAAFSESVRCKAATLLGRRCAMFTRDDSGLCSRHRGES